MIKVFTRRTASQGILLLGIAAAFGSSAQTWPSRAITIVVPYAAGGVTDAMVREVARKMSGDLGQPVVVDNKPGGGTMIAAQLVAGAQPDGYTLLANVGANMVTGPLLQPTPNFNPLVNLTPVALLTANPLILVSHKSTGLNTMADVLAAARAKPGTLAIASYGAGTPSHLAIELLKMNAKIDVIHVPYKGSAPAMVDVLGGRVPLLMDVLPSHIQTMAQGVMVGIAVGQKSRSELAPQVPTFAEGGLAGMDLSTWVGLAAPAGTPADIVNRISLAASKAVNDAELKKKMTDRGMSMVYASPTDFGKLIRSDIQTSAMIIKNANIKID
jgi:tripartite-type tricarboxylate transporter receptor subunit TctC